jgi:hypothetical protein
MGNHDELQAERLRLANERRPLVLAMLDRGLSGTEMERLIYITARLGEIEMIMLEPHIQRVWGLLKQVEGNGREIWALITEIKARA